MAAAQAFLKESVLNGRNCKPGVVKVVGNVEGPLADGSMVKEVADSTVYMTAVFTQESLDAFQLNFEDSFNSPPDWDHALLLLNQYCVKLQPPRTCGNATRIPRFILVIEKFGLYNLHEGFYSKNEPKDIMADEEVQAKVWEIQFQQSSSLSQITDVNSQNCDVSLSVLIDQLGESSLPDTMLSQDTQQSDSAVQERSDQRHTRQSALQAMRSLNVEDFIVSPDQQALLDAIPEWKPDYIAPAAESLPEQLTLNEPSGTLGSDPPDFVTGPTLRVEVNSDSSPAEPESFEAKTSKPLSASSQTGKQRPSKGVKRKAQESDPPRRKGTAAQADKADNGSNPESSMETGGVESRAQLLEVQFDGPGENASEVSEASKNSLDSVLHHPDVSFSISSSSYGEESSGTVDAAGTVGTSVAAHTIMGQGRDTLDLCFAKNQNLGSQKQSETETPSGESEVMSKGGKDMSDPTPSDLANQISAAVGKRGLQEMNDSDTHMAGLDSNQRSHSPQFAGEVEEELTTSPSPSPQTASQSRTQERSDSLENQFPCTMEFTVQMSQGFTPSDMLTQDLAPDVSYSGRKNRGASDGDTASDNGHTVPAENSMDLPQHRGSGDGKGTRLKDSRNETSQKHKKSRIQRATNTEKDRSCSGSCYTSKEIEEQEKQEKTSGDKTVSSPARFYHSTQNVSSDESQSPALCINLSPVQYHSNSPDKQQISVTEREEEERLQILTSYSNAAAGSPQRLTSEGEILPDRESHKGRHSEGCCDHAVTLLPDSLDVVSQEIEDCANKSRILVDYSGSDNTEDSFDNKLMRQAMGQRSEENHTGIQTISSSDPVVIPDSSQEDVVVVSSSNGSSVDDVGYRPHEPEQQIVSDSCDLTDNNSNYRKEGICRSACTSTLAGIEEETGHTSGSETPSAAGSEDCESKQNEQVSRLDQRDPSISTSTVTVSNTCTEGDHLVHSTDPTSEDEPSTVEKINSSGTKRSRGLQDSDISREKSSKQRRIHDVNSNIPGNCSSHDRVFSTGNVSEPGSPFSRQKAMHPEPSHGADDNHQTSDKNIRSSKTSVRQPSHIQETTLDSSTVVQPSRKDKNPEKNKQSRSHPHQVDTTTEQQEIPETVERDTWLCSKSVRTRRTQASTSSAKQPATESRKRSSLHTNIIRSYSHTVRERATLHKSPGQQTAGREICLRTSSASGTSRDKNDPNQQPTVAEEADLVTEGADGGSTGSKRRNTHSEHSVISAPSSADQVRKKRSNKEISSVNSSPNAKRVSRAAENSSSCSTKVSERNRSLLSAGMSRQANCEVNATNSRNSMSHGRSAASEQASASVTTNSASGEVASGLDTTHPSRMGTPRIGSNLIEQEMHARTELVVDNIHERVKRNLNIWLERKTGSEDPQQRRLQRLKLTETILNKLEECLRRPCT